MCSVFCRMRLMASLLFVLSVLAACGGESESGALECEVGSGDEACESCEAGTICAGGDAEFAGCGEGTWDHDGDPATECVAWTSCVAGEFVVAEGSAATDRQCGVCEEGTYSTGENASNCEVFAECIPGEFVEQAGSSMEARICGVCEEGSYSREVNATGCESWTVCQAGQYVENAGSATADRSCKNCSVGTFSKGGNAESCEFWKECVAGEYVLQAGSGTEDRQCRECDPGTYSDRVNATECEAWTVCENDEYVLVEGTATMDRQCASPQEAGAACTMDEECESNDCQRGHCKLAGWSVIPAGVFTQGAPPAEPGRLMNEGPQREVTITRAFLLQETAVTQAQWVVLMGNNPSHHQSGDYAPRPVERVIWWDAVAYTNALSSAEGLEECYEVSGCSGTPGVDYECASIDFVGLDCEGYRLPTEAEWEYAARAGTTGMTYAGDHHGEANCNASPLLSSIAWWCGNAGTTRPVGQKTPNAWGLYDMIGNVWNWTADWYVNYQMGDITDPEGPATGTHRVVRGCSWSNYANECRAAFRPDFPPTFRSRRIGFRPARTL